MKKILGANFKWFILFFVLGAGLTFALGHFIQFHAMSNDFWNILYYGRGMTLAEPESLYNGFFPFGYAFLVGQMPFTYVRPLAYLLNALLAGLFTASVSTLIASTRSIPATIIAFYCSIAAPFVFQNANTLSPDIGSAAFTAFAVFLLRRNLLEENQNELSSLNSVLIGISLGLAFLWRTHAIVSAFAIFFGYFLLFGIRPLRSRVLMLSAFLAVFALQVAVNLISGHGAIETAQAFNLYKYFHGVNWTNPPTPAEIEKFSLYEAIAKDRARFFDLYLPLFKYFISHAWASGLAFLLSPKGRYSRYSLFSFVFILLYAIPISLGDSARSPVILMGIYLPSVAVLLVVMTDQIKEYINPGRWVTGLVGTLFVLAGFQIFYGWAGYDSGLIRASRAESKVLVIIEQTLLSHGMKSPSEVFADRYDFYTPNTMPYRSRQIGNWSEDWVWGFSDEFPPLPNDTWEVFARASKEQGIRFLALSPNSFYRGEIFPPIYYGEVELEALGLRFIGQRGNIRIYQFR
ncbi:MAG: hypothetical protein FJZ86_11300 [Chloroflexi bacterium]|nr:hypothetical protein [Chloroflexota bacterium]